MSSKGVALVTGAAQGIGRAIALRLANDGFDLGLNDIPSNAQKLESLVEEIKAKGRAVSVHIADVSNEEQVQAMIAGVVEQQKSLDVMVANAGICKYAHVLETTTEDWNRIMEVNVRGTFLCFKFAALQMIAQGRGGRMIAASSVAGKQGFNATAAYCASKFAVRGLVQASAQEFGKHGITVNAYAPGSIETDMLKYLDESSSGRARTLTINASALKTTGNPEDIAGLVSYIASEESRFITGQSISINGGLYFD
ncbi:NAD-binding protein [Mycena chlorophos]|uniref:NAD-binding protein n=1 Tax=Mycena chlorophos TaxID=658473 RepID=A0A8H6WES6_MYCCL|nr:NAD-binding protein [Mycena chlorophos]